MPTPLEKNRYPGVNPHLNSMLQTPSTDDQPAVWSAFHGRHVSYIADFLNEQLPEQYVAFSEQSLQVRTSGWEDIPTSRPRPDISVLKQSAGGALSALSAALQPTWEATILESIPQTEYYSAVVIREVTHQRTLGKPVTWLEVLSPGNKPGGSNAPRYETKRREALASGIPLIEIDYLHESHSPIQPAPQYPDDEAAYPYTITISDPRPNWSEGRVRMFGFHVLQPLPTLLIPLGGSDTLEFDFNPVYQHTFERGRWGKFVDYTCEPERFDTYSPADQARVRARMAEIAAELP